MVQMELNELKYEAKRLAYQGVRYDDIRKRLRDVSSNSTLIVDALIGLDFHISDFQIAQQARIQLLNQMIIYGALSGFCILLTMYTILTRQKVYIFIALAIFGFSLKFYDLYQKRRRPIESFLSQNNRIKGNSKFRR